MNGPNLFSFWLFLFLSTHLILVSTYNDPFLIGKSPEEVRAIFLAKARNASALDPNRWDRVEQALTKAAGVYNYSHPLQQSRPEIQKSVMIIVLEFLQKDESAHYKVYLKNFICYVRSYQYKLVLYVALHTIADTKAEIKELEDMGVSVLEYPDELFWELHATKEGGILRGRGHADYDRQYPAFRAYGAIVMLVPILEVLMHGYNVIFMDVDVALVHDPVPYMTQGTANIVSSLEHRHCVEFYSTTYPHHFDWFAMEPNTGLMYLRHGYETMRAFKILLERIVERNLLNDQRVFERRAMGLHWNGDCNEVGGWKEYNAQLRLKQIEEEKAQQSSRNNNSNSSSSNTATKAQRRKLSTTATVSGNGGKDDLGNRLRQQHSSDRTVDATGSSSDRSTKLSIIQQKLKQLSKPASPNMKKATFCFLNELHFQNGITAIGCPNGKNRNIRDEYMLEMAKYGIPIIPPSNPNATPTSWSPVTVHANYADKKTHELQVRGLWLLRADYDNRNYTKPSQFCVAHRFHAINTYYGQHNWTAELMHIEERRQDLYRSLSNNTLVKTLSDGSVYVLDEFKVRHLVPNAETFVARFGESAWGHIRTLSSAMMNNLTVGEPIPAVK